MLRLTSYLVDKPRPALGIDGAIDPDHLTTVDFGAVEDFIPDTDPAAE